MKFIKAGRIITEALKSLFKKPFTVKYSSERKIFVPVPDRFRGRLIYDYDNCIGCTLCIKVCPAGAILATPERKVNFYMDRCIFCGECAETCPVKVISFSKDFELAYDDKEKLIVRKR
ncbi:MAG: 4Fe-4S binding protein [Candidatus Odinarchaeum yellowstonii]|jgi:formate hydrogenlyase subunit 6/NADH:ubiquinone oxidoreductase subunit I|uniref:4Fe-4S binding protein n=1 Tax=Odinarchaeota yellowstonii (strain LCB_4) TaxID=1841599 RepID=A0AAF0IBD0_ODILC|nr:MAG: 4Fe-4S binding protein [Candidatus Odinarchaeum yellowstonii]